MSTRMKHILGWSVASLVLFLIVMYFAVGYVNPSHGEFYVFKNMTGDTLPAGQIIAQENQRGITREMHTQGWKFWFGNKWLVSADGPHTVTEIATDAFGILHQQDGKPLPEGWLLAPAKRDANGSVTKNEYGLPESEYKGTLDEYLTPGQYRIHPYLYNLDMVKWMEVKPGSVGVLTRRDGLPLAEGEFIAPVKRNADGSAVLKDGIPMSDYKGILEEVLKPGVYRIHPKLYEFQAMPAVEVLAGNVGVVTAKTGKPMTGELLAKESERGVQEKTLPPGTYYLNPYMYKVDIVSIQSQKTEFLEDNNKETVDAIGFPSLDGFNISIDYAVEWRVMKDRVSEVFTLIGDIEAVREKIITTNTRGIGRVEGSKYGAKDFIQGAGREKFESAVFNELKEVCAEKGIEVLRGLVRKIDVPEDIKTPLRDAEIAKQELLRNQQQMETAKSAASKMEEETRIAQKKANIEAETQKMVAEVEAQKKLRVAQVDLETAKMQAEATKTRGDADAHVIFAKAKAEADGVQVMTNAFGGGESYARFTFAKSLGENTRFVWMPSNEGTFWGGGGSEGLMGDLMKWLVQQQKSTQKGDTQKDNK